MLTDKADTVITLKKLDASLFFLNPLNIHPLESGMGSAKLATDKWG